jgi:hypothetical protein
MIPGKSTGKIQGFLRKIAQPKRPTEDISGLYLGEDRYLKIVSQPSNRPEYVSSISRTATDFQLAARYGNIGLVAHNYLGGRYFLSLKIGDCIFVTGSKRSKWEYEIKQILQYQALDPRSPRSRFIDLQNNQMLTATDVFKKVYTGKHRLVLQTCIERGEIREWGRHFIIARPVNQFLTGR